MRSLAVLSLFPPARGGIAAYTADLVRELSRSFRVTGYAPGLGSEAHPGSDVEVRDLSSFRRDESLTLCQVGNSAELSVAMPWLPYANVITLHDASQYDLAFPFFERHPLRLMWESLGLEPPARRELWRGFASGGLAGAVEALRSHPQKRLLYPFTRFVLRGARHVVVHSRFLARHVASIRRSATIDVIPHGAWPVAAVDREASRRALAARLGRDLDDTLLLASFGVIQPHKRHVGVLEGLARYVEDDARVLYLVIGPRDDDYDLDADVARLGLRDHVAVVDSYVPMTEVNTLLGGADLFFNLRHPTLGSTSGALVKALALGLPAVVTDAGSFAEIPRHLADVVPPPGQGESEACERLMRQARERPERLRERGARARAFIENECAWPVVADRYARVLAAA